MVGGYEADDCWLFDINKRIWKQLVSTYTRGFIGESNSRVIFGKFVCEKQLADFLLAI